MTREQLARFLDRKWKYLYWNPGPQLMVATHAPVMKPHSDKWDLPLNAKMRPYPEDLFGDIEGLAYDPKQVYVLERNPAVGDFVVASHQPNLDLKAQVVYGYVQDLKAGKTIAVVNGTDYAFFRTCDPFSLNPEQGA